MTTPIEGLRVTDEAAAACEGATPGPWNFDGTTEMSTTLFGAGDTVVIADPVGVDQLWWPTNTPAAANQALIALAPDLLADRATLLARVGALEGEGRVLAERLTLSQGLHRFLKHSAWCDFFRKENGVSNQLCSCGYKDALIAYSAALAHASDKGGGEVGS